MVVSSPHERSVDLALRGTVMGNSMRPQDPKAVFDKWEAWRRCPSDLIVAVDVTCDRDSERYQDLLRLASDFHAKLADVPGVTNELVAAEVRELGTSSTLVIASSPELGQLIATKARFNRDRQCPTNVVVIGQAVGGLKSAVFARSLKYVDDVAVCQELLRDRYAMRAWPRVRPSIVA